jgi:hypothetical protein
LNTAYCGASGREGCCTCFQMFILHNSSCQVQWGSCKKLPVLHFSDIFFCGIIDSSTLSFENWVPLKPVLGGVMNVALIHYPSCTNSIKPSLQTSCYFVLINAAEGSLCFQVSKNHFVLYLTTADVKCRVTVVKSCPYFILVLLYFSGPSGSLMPALLSVENRVLVVWGMLHSFIISHLQIQSNLVFKFHVILLWFMLPRDHFVFRCLSNVIPILLFILKGFQDKLKTFPPKRLFSKLQQSDLKHAIEFENQVIFS